MEYILITAMCIFDILIILIFTLFIYELGVIKKIAEIIDNIYLEIVTHPGTTKVYYIIGDAVYMIGGSVLGAGIIEFIQNNKILFNILFFGTILIIFGAYIREKTRKDK